MTEDEAEARVCADVPRETAERLRTYVAHLRAESARQNLIAASTTEHLWERHILDSAQLLALADSSALWIDIGSGAGLPGIVIAILRKAPIYLIEPRAKRAAFLQSLIEELDLTGHAEVIGKTTASAPDRRAAIISARAVASLDALLGMGARFADADTLWILPKGRSAAEELATARASWQGDFKLVPSQTDSSASIVVARGVRSKRR